MNNSQIATIKADIIAKAALVYEGSSFALLQSTTRLDKIAAYYNEEANPVVNLWRPDISISDVTNNIVFSDYISLSAAKREAWMAMSQGNVIDATIDLVRTNFVTIFGNGTTTTTNVVAIAKKKATNLEALFTVNGVSELYKYTITADEILKILRS